MMYLPVLGVVDQWQALLYHPHHCETNNNNNVHTDDGESTGAGPALLPFEFVHVYYVICAPSTDRPPSSVIVVGMPSRGTVGGSQIPIIHTYIQQGVFCRCCGTIFVLVWCIDAPSVHSRDILDECDPSAKRRPRKSCCSSSKRSTLHHHLIISRQQGGGGIVPIISKTAHDNNSNNNHVCCIDWNII